MPAKLNTEFNYRFQVEGNTPWEKIKQLQNFLEGRKEAAALEKVSDIKRKSKIAKLEYLKKTNAEEYLILELEAELLEIEASDIRVSNVYDLNRQEILIIEKILKELYEIVEPTRLKHPDGAPYSDEEMFEINAANEFTVMIGKEIYAEIVSVGHPSPAKIRNAMSNPYTLNALKQCGLLPEQVQYIEGNANPLKIEINQTLFEQNLISENKQLNVKQDK
jgi:hypothetical protein